ncbi:MAG TPA: LPS export ABC transporter periplasmic protein LptC [Allosphingosinicella sp.]|nr:LPS export ABC transporter periplasmic protein LptC [Allosphingosinicella sp.]
MSEAALPARAAGRGSNSWAKPGSFHDWLIGFLKIALPAAVGVILAYLALAPLSKRPEISFLLDKDKVEVTPERMRVEGAQYRGQDSFGRPFLISAQTAVQATSQDPVVEISDMAAQIGLDEGPARIVANRARYDMSLQHVNVAGPILFTAADGYRLETRDVLVDLNQRSFQSRGRVEGRMPLGTFSAGRLRADLASRTVVLDGRARIHIVQGGLR